jgi:hypothetical protein
MKQETEHGPDLAMKGGDVHRGEAWARQARSDRTSEPCTSHQTVREAHSGRKEGGFDASADSPSPRAITGVVGNRVVGASREQHGQRTPEPALCRHQLHPAASQLRCAARSGPVYSCRLIRGGGPRGTSAVPCVGQRALILAPAASAFRIASGVSLFTCHGNRHSARSNPARHAVASRRKEWCSVCHPRPTPH